MMQLSHHEIRKKSLQDFKQKNNLPKFKVNQLHQMSAESDNTAQAQQLLIAQKNKVNFSANLRSQHQKSHM